jgi:hypothetical protein
MAKRRSMLLISGIIIVGLLLLYLYFFPAISIEKFQSVPSRCMVNGKALGYPSTDNSIRLYNAPDCAAMNGIYIPDGECLMQGEGSYSGMCAVLNHITPPTPPADPTIMLPPLPPPPPTPPSPVVIPPAPSVPTPPPFQSDIPPPPPIKNAKIVPTTTTHYGNDYPELSFRLNRYNLRLTHD